MTIRFLTSILLVGLLVLLATRAQAQELVPEEANPKWFQCREAADCTIIRGFCNQPEAVNQVHAKEYADWVKSSPPTHCSLLPLTTKICVTCREHRCNAKVERNRALQPEPLNQNIIEPEK